MDILIFRIFFLQWKNHQLKNANNKSKSSPLYNSLTSVNSNSQKKIEEDQYNKNIVNTVTLAEHLICK